MKRRVIRYACPAVLLSMFLVFGPVSAAEPVAPESAAPIREALAKLVTGHIGRLLVLRSELNVTTDQKAQIREVVVGYKDRIAPVVKSLKEKRRALRDAVRAETPDEMTIRNAADELGKAIGEAAVLASAVVGQTREFMTDEQRSRIQQFIQANDQSQDGFFKEFLSQ